MIVTHFVFPFIVCITRPGEITPALVISAIVHLPNVMCEKPAAIHLKLYKFEFAHIKGHVVGMPTTWQIISVHCWNWLYT